MLPASRGQQLSNQFSKEQLSICSDTLTGSLVHIMIKFNSSRLNSTEFKSVAFSSCTEATLLFQMNVQVSVYKDEPVTD